MAGQPYVLRLIGSGVRKTQVESGNAGALGSRAIRLRAFPKIMAVSWLLGGEVRGRTGNDFRWKNLTYWKRFGISG